MKFEKNVGEADRIVRLILGAVLLLSAAFLQLDLPVRVLVALLGMISIFTGIVGSCMLYSFFGFKTSK
ncbi:MAG: DUF2892 domain-containing protein [Candidatus Micrarchaeota archaeon]|nr:DUF2892 domain-containing protein [Candidatus Micrarchaeota archaeon]